MSLNTLFLTDIQDEYTTVTVSFLDFAVIFCEDCSCDKVSVFDGPDDTAPLLGEFCTAGAAGRFRGSGTELFVRFETGSGEGANGWRAELVFGRWDEEGEKNLNSFVWLQAILLLK